MVSGSDTWLSISAQFWIVEGIGATMGSHACVRNLAIHGLDPSGYVFEELAEYLLIKNRIEEAGEYFRKAHFANIV